MGWLILKVIVAWLGVGLLVGMLIGRCIREGMGDEE